MGRAVADAAVGAGLQLVPVTFSNLEKPNRTLQVGNVDIMIHGPSERENILSSIYNEYPNVIVVDYTVPDAVNGKQLNNISCLILSSIFFHAWVELY